MNERALYTLGVAAFVVVILASVLSIVVDVQKFRHPDETLRCTWKQDTAQPNQFQVECDGPHRLLAYGRTE